MDLQIEQFPCHRLTMINRVRTLLLNISGVTDVVPDYPGEEFIPPEYRARALPEYLALPHRILFGTRPDRLFLNFRSRQLMTLLHNIELEDHVLDPDPRITYFPFVDDSYFDGLFGVVISQVSGTTPVELFVAGTPVADEDAGLLRMEWRLEIIDSGTVRVTRRTPPLSPAILPYTVQAGLSSPIGLPGSQLFARFRPAAPQTAWIVTSTARPKTDLGTVFVQLAQATTAAQARIFAARGEPVDTFRNLFNDHPQMAYRLGGYLLALARTVEQQPGAP